jgi:glutathionylspermidine synthase
MGVRQMQQIVPDVKKSPGQQFSEDKGLFRKQLTTQGNNIPYPTEAFNPYPFGICVSEFQIQSRLQRIVRKAIQQVVKHYGSDRRIQKLISLSETVLSLLQALDKSSYLLGSFRPDFLYALDGTIKICEINARFPTNGYWISHYLNNIIPSLPYLPLGLNAIEDLEKIPRVFCSRFKTGDRVGILKGCERGWDIYSLHFELNQAGYPCRIVSPEEIQVKGNWLGDSQGIFQNLVLELHQHELLQTAFLSNLGLAIAPTICFNDLRTIFIVHDKRFLAVLSSETIMKDYLIPEEVTLLHQSIVPTYVMSQSPEIVEAALAEPKNWIIKPNLFGKGEGILIGRFCPRSQWIKNINQYKKSDYILQKYVAQKKFNILTCVRGEVINMPMYVVGMLLGFDEVFLGTGIYRSSPQEIVNVASGGTILFPTIQGEKYAK